MMQTVEIEFMHEFGLQTLWYLHIQPPLFDFIRFALSMNPWSEIGYVAGVEFDRRLYIFYIFIYSCFNVLVYTWSKSLGLSKVLSLVVTALWSIYPGNLAMATLLDSTYLSAFLVAIFIFSIQETLRLRERKYFYLFIVFFILATYTRTVFQIYILLFLPVISFYLLTKISDRRKPLVVAAILGSILVFALPLKQKILFGTTSTTTFAGQHKIEGIWYYPTKSELSQIDIQDKYIDNARKYENKFNNAWQVAWNIKYEELFRQIVIEKPNLVLNGVKKSSLQGLARLNISTQNYWANAIVGFVPWLDISATFMIGKYYLALGVFVVFAALLRLALQRKLCSWRDVFYYWPIYFSLLSIFLSIVVGSNRYEWTEAERLKFLIEFPVLIYLVSAVYWLFFFNVKESPLKSIDDDQIV